MATSLAAFPQVPWGVGHGLKVLGLPVEYPGSSTFRRGKLQGVVDSMLQACHILTGLGDAQEQHVLLRFYLDACRVLYFLRGVDC